MTTTTTGVGLRPPRNQADPRAVNWWRVQALMLAVPLVIGVVAAYWIFTDHPLWLGVVVALVSVFCLLGALVLPRAYYQAVPGLLEPFMR